MAAPSGSCLLLPALAGSCPANRSSLIAGHPGNKLDGEAASSPPAHQRLIISGLTSTLLKITS